MERSKIKRRVDLTGQRFGRWTVLKFSRSNPNPKLSSLWLCRCDCGTERETNTNGLRMGTSQSCGCRHREIIRKPRIAPGESAFNKLFYAYKFSASRRHIYWELTRDEFRQLTALCCVYCGTPPFNDYPSKSTRQSWHTNFIYNGVDRLDNNKGYTLDNSVPCCKHCNWMKRDMSHADFLAHLRKILQYSQELV